MVSDSGQNVLSTSPGLFCATILDYHMACSVTTRTFNTAGAIMYNVSYLLTQYSYTIAYASYPLSRTMTHLTLIVAATRTNGIGQNAQLPWRLAKEMAYFKRVTTTAPDGSMNVVIMGRNTWESIPQKFRPLAKRLNIVISSDKQYEL